MRRSPRVLLVVTLTIALTATIADAQAPEPPLTRLEQFAARPGAAVVWSQQIGQLDSPVAHARLTAVAIEEPTSTPRIMRGLRIDLEHRQPNPDCNLRFHLHVVLCSRPNAAILFDEDSLPRVRAGVARGNAEDNLIFRFWTGGGGQEKVGLIIGGYNFDHWLPEHLTALLDKAVVELKNAPR